jgi:hypothetical protein
MFAMDETGSRRGSGRSRGLAAGMVLLACASQSVAAGRPGDPKSFGLGLALGAPTGLSGKYWLGRTKAIAGAVGGLGYRGVVLHGDYLRHRRDIIRSAPAGTTALYYGPGAFLASGGRVVGDRAAVGVRGVIGMGYLFPRDPFDLFIELAPNLVFGGGVGFGLQGALGGRFYF